MLVCGPIAARVGGTDSKLCTINGGTAGLKVKTRVVQENIFIVLSQTHLTSVTSTSAKALNAEMIDSSSIPLDLAATFPKAVEFSQMGVSKAS